MDSLSLILDVLEGIIVGAVIVASLLATKKILTAATFLPKGFRLLYSILFGASIILIALIDSIIDLVNYSFHKLSKFLSFTCKYIKFSAFSNFKFIKERFDSYSYRTKVYLGRLRFSRGSPGFKLISLDTLSSQSFLKISPIILQ